ncbi:MAG: hypothetical protein RBS17_01835 [Coriobacteriia bacterium]|nr:hypothetical protein [Coriobacteriia bacterium]
MRLLQRVSALVGWLLLALAGALYTLEAAGVIEGDWRVHTERMMQTLAQPTIEQWAAALLGLLAATLSVLIVMAQSTPYRRTVKYHIVVDDSGDGQTLVSSAAVLSGVSAALGMVDGVKAVSAVGTRRRIDARITVADDADVQAVASSCDGKLDEGFWSRLGIAPYRVDLRFEFGRRAGRDIS